MISAFHPILGEVSRRPGFESRLAQSIFFFGPLRRFAHLAHPVKFMTSMFGAAYAFNQTINAWNMGGVNTTFGMFGSASSFNQPLSNWNMSSVTDMSSMFSQASQFNQDISSWSVSAVTMMENLFSGARAFNSPLNSWQMQSVQNLRGMFANATSFNQPISAWRFSPTLIDTSNMFTDATSFNQPIGAWDVRNIVRMDGTFARATAFNQNLNGWNTSSLTVMSNIFNGATSFNGAIDKWDVSRVSDFSGAFSGATSFNQPLVAWNVSRVTTMAGMFLNAASFNQDLSYWCVPDPAVNRTLFATNARLSPLYYPRWGTCDTVPPPVQRVCTAPVPAGAVNVTCIDGVLSYSIPPDVFFGGSSGNASTTIFPATTTILVGNATLTQVSVTVPVVVSTNGAAQSGVVEVQGCLNISGTIQVSLPSLGGSKLNTTSDLELFRSLRPECFSAQVNVSVIQADAPKDVCDSIDADARSRRNSDNTVSLVLVFQYPQDCGLTGSLGLSPGAIAAAVVVPIVVVIIIVSAIVLVILRRRKDRKAAANGPGWGEIDEQ